MAAAREVAISEVNAISEAELAKEAAKRSAEEAARAAEGPPPPTHACARTHVLHTHLCDVHLCIFAPMHMLTYAHAHEG